MERKDAAQAVADYCHAEIELGKPCTCIRA